jgi:hypothetical protein
MPCMLTGSDYVVFTTADLATPCLVSRSFEVERLEVAPGAPVEPSCQRLAPPVPRAPSPDVDQTSQTGPPETTQHPRVPSPARSAQARKQAPTTWLPTRQKDSGGAQVGRPSTPTANPGQRHYDDSPQASGPSGPGANSQKYKSSLYILHSRE